eukprot:5237637-Amphidinium_carterae.1
MRTLVCIGHVVCRWECIAHLLVANHVAFGTQHSAPSETCLCDSSGSSSQGGNPCLTVCRCSPTITPWNL